MNKNVAIPIALLLLSALLTLMFNPVVLLVVGVVICVVAVLKYRAQKVTESKLGVNLLFRSGLAVITGAIIAVIFVLAAKSGLFGK
jgi:heme/copper-type cytochrome/quinol oxidase subunit 2